LVYKQIQLLGLSKNQPAQTVVERYIQLKGCKFVDEIVPYATEQDLDDIYVLQN
jgi:glycerol-3-phosphate cytidylyltransferase-like family protein